jgi:hypothetical protein
MLLAEWAGKTDCVGVTDGCNPCAVSADPDRKGRQA